MTGTLPLQRACAPFEVGYGARGKRGWWIYCKAIGPHWNACDSAGRLRQFATLESACRAAAKLSYQGEALANAQAAAETLRDYVARGGPGWWNWRSIRAELLRCDPAGLFTSDIEGLYP